MRDSKFIFGNVSAAFGVAAALLVSGCKREQVTSYQVPKEDHSVKPLSMPGMGPGMMGGNAPEAEESAPAELKWTAPKGWVEKSSQSQMGGTSFHIDGGDGKYADVRVVPLRAGPEIEQQSVNMWRGELGLPEVELDRIKGEDIQVAGTTAHLYDLKSDEPRFAGKYKSRTTGATLNKDGKLWFIKMTGEDSVVSAQQQNFKDFLASFHFEGGGMPANHPQIASAGASSGGGGAVNGPNWKIPATWTQVPAGQMITAAYRASKGAATADITVSSFPGDVGGLVANVNRWRGQVGLSAIDAGEVATQVKTVDLSDGSKASVVDITGMSARTGKTARLYGLIVPRGGKTWFYKMLGDSDAIAAETTNLVEFAGIAH